MTATTKNLLAANAPGASEQSFHPGQQFVGPQNNRISQNLTQAKPMGGGMAPPASPAMGGSMKDQKDVKPMINNPSGIPEGSPHNAPAAPGQGGLHLTLRGAHMALHPQRQIPLTQVSRSPLLRTGHLQYLRLRIPRANHNPICPIYHLLSCLQTSYNLCRHWRT
ncbi:hypothetical protein BDR07DRAFT_771179 [Suillus spraguei]|nr:hypothetical protein BDR07DRAFT_771179 [Suillus spraguei]